MTKNDATNNNMLNISIDKEALKSMNKKSFDELMQALGDTIFAHKDDPVAKTISILRGNKQQPPKDKECDGTCHNCGNCHCNDYNADDYDYYNEEEYDSVDGFSDEYGVNYEDTVRYPGDEYIHPAVIGARAVEESYSPITQYASKAMRATNNVMLERLENAHKSEMATLLEYITQQNLITTQVLLDEIGAIKNKK